MDFATVFMSYGTSPCPLHKGEASLCANKYKFPIQILPSAFKLTVVQRLSAEGSSIFVFIRVSSFLL